MRSRVLLAAAAVLAACFALRAPVSPLLSRVRSYLPTPLRRSSFATASLAASLRSQSPVMTSQTSRTVVKGVYAVEQDEGVGARVRRSIGGMSLRHIDPFLMLDHFTATPGAGFPSHPHRGQATLTRIVSGAMDHADSTGREGRLFPGDIQYMEAGRGVAHSEMPVTEDGIDNCEGMQLWLDLPTDRKRAPATYQDLKASDIPNAHPSEGVEIAVVAGKAQGNASEGTVVSPLVSNGGCEYYDIKLSKGASVFQNLTSGWTAFVYVLRGDVKIGGKACTKHNTQVLSAESDQSGIQLEALSEARMIVVSGRPLNQPIFQHGPFIVSSREEAIQAIRDFQSGQNGFEGAAAWLSARS